MNKERVSRRLNLLGSSAGSVVSVATWCSLHAQYADVVVPCLMEKMKSESTPDAVRASVLYVVHEMVLTCVSSGTTETGKQGLLMAISKLLPGAVQTVMDRVSADLTVFSIALEKTVGWWAALRAFPNAWLHELQRKQATLEARLTSSTGAPSTALATASVPAQLQKLTDAIARYRDAKEQWLRECREKQQSPQQQDGEHTGGSPTALTPTAEVALRQLTVAHKTAASILGLGSAPVAWCDAERAELLGLHPQGSAAAGVTADGVKKEESLEPPTARVKLEGSGGDSTVGTAASAGPATNEQGSPADGDDDDDVLGAFYGS